MTVFDIVRYAVFATFGVGVGLMALTNLIAFRVLRPPRRIGFLWWHITAISLSFLCLGVVSIEYVTGELGDPPGWRAATVLLGTTLFMVAQWIIFNVERQRLVNKQAIAVVDSVR